MLLPREPTSRPRIIAAPAAAAREGVAVIDGRLVESLHVVEAERQVALADAIAALGG
jgi:citrate lyase subunit beta/citryl-CoA lyase